MKSTTVKVLKCIGFFILAVIVFMGFVYPFSLVPKLYEDRAREMTLERIENGSIAVKESYIEESVHDAVVGNIKTIFTTAICIAMAVAFIVYLLSVRPPHDCGGINWFNPIGLVFVAAISALLPLVVGLAVINSPSKGALQFMLLVRSLTYNFSFGDKRFFLMILIPAALEIIFRGIIFSYLEKIHFSVAIVLSTLMYGAAAYLAVGSYMKIAVGSTDAALCAMLVAIVIGAVEAVITWRLRSGIPAILSHIMISCTSLTFFNTVSARSVSLVPMAILLVAVLAVFVLVFTFLPKKVKVFAHDWPLQKHHEWMNKWLYGPKKKAEENAEEEKPKEKAPEKSSEKKAEKKSPDKGSSGKKSGKPSNGGKKGKKGKK